MNTDPGVRIDYYDAVPVVRLSGDVDVSMTAKLRERLFSAVRNEDLGIVVDLTEVRYIDSAGVNVLFELAERLAQGQLRFAVVVPEGGLVERVLTIVDLKSVAELHRTADFAIAAVQGA